MNHLNNKIYGWFVFIFLQHDILASAGNLNDLVQTYEAMRGMQRIPFKRSRYIDIQMLALCGFDSYEDSIKDNLLLLKRVYGKT